MDGTLVKMNLLRTKLKPINATAIDLFKNDRRCQLKVVDFNLVGSITRSETTTEAKFSICGT